MWISGFRQGKSAAFSIVTAEAPLHLNGKSPLILLRETSGDWTLLHDFASPFK